MTIAYLVECNIHNCLARHLLPMTLSLHSHARARGAVAQCVPKLTCAVYAMLLRQYLPGSSSALISSTLICVLSLRYLSASHSNSTYNFEDAH